MKRPNLKRVKKTTDDMLNAYSDTSKLKKADFKAKLRTVKKEEDRVKVTFRTKGTVNKKTNDLNRLNCYFAEGRGD